VGQVGSLGFRIITFRAMYVVDTGDLSHITKRDRMGNSGVGGRTGCASGKG
jgi:hypothetical protein